MTLIDNMLKSPKFGAGARIGETFAIFQSHFVPLATVAVILGISTMLPSFFLIGEVLSGSALDSSGNVAVDSAFRTNPVMAILFIGLVPVLIYTVMAGTLVLIAQDAKTGQPTRIGAHLGTALSRILPLFFVSLIVGAMIVLASVALVIPGLWVMGVFAVVVPAIMIEKAGFGSLSRSASLTKEYRWPIVGMVVVIYIVTMVLTTVVGFVTPILPAPVALVLSGAVGGLTVALLSIALVVVYMRLREIKEGVGVADLAKVFA